MQPGCTATTTLHAFQRLLRSATPPRARPPRCSCRPSKTACTAPLRAIRFEGGIITALDQDGTLVVPVSLDYAIWAERTARRTEEFAAIDKSRDDIKSLALWTDGRLSDRLR